MKQLLVFATVVAVVALGLWASIARTQTKVLISTDGSDPAKWDKNLDGPIAAAGNHKVIFENENIRVQSVAVPPNTEEPYHLHPYSSVLVTDMVPQSGADRDIKGNNLKDVYMARTKTFPQVALQPPNALHSVKNTDPKVPLHLIRIESKHAIPQLVSFPGMGPIESQGTLPISTDGSDPSKWDPKKASAIAAPGNHKILFENDNLRVISVTVPAGTTEPLHDHPYYSFLFVDSLPRSADHDATGKTLPSPATLPKVPFGFLQPPQGLHAAQDLDAKKDMHLIRIEFKKGFKQL